jgi:CBS domain containing-hemolysin-like protein
VTVRLLAIILLLIVNAFFVAAEAALARARRARLEAQMRAGDRLARLAVRALSDSRRMLSATRLGIALSTLGIGALVIDLVADATGQLWPSADLQVSPAFGIGATLAIVATACLYVAFSTLFPGSVGAASAEQAMRLLAPGLVLFARLATPLLAPIEWLSSWLTRAFGARATEADPMRSPDELRLMVEQIEERGEIEETDAALIEGVFDFSEKSAREVMTPRTDIVAIPVEATLDEAVRIASDEQFSRYPVIDETIDDIVGIVLAKDLLRVIGKPPAAFSMLALMRPIHVIPGSRAVEDVLADFKRLKEHMAIVLDEYGGTAGLVTMEDLLEEIVGEIWDEYDDADVPPPPEPSGEVVVPGATNVGELNERFGLSLPVGTYATVGGYVFGTLGRVPVVGDRVSGGGAVFTVREMEGRRVEAIAVDLHSAGDRRASEREGPRP